MAKGAGQPHAELRRRIEALLVQRYRGVINNVHRGDYVECLVAEAAGKGWNLTWAAGLDWALWDISHESGARIEVKQSAARQTWDLKEQAPQRTGKFSIRLKSWHWNEDGVWKELPNRARTADIYVFAWHGERRHCRANHADPAQWRFYVVAESELPYLQESITLTNLDGLASPCGFGELGREIELVRSGLGKLKQDQLP